MASELRAYCDDSGEGGRDFVIAGYLAPASEWLKLEPNWREALAHTGLSEFHMHDLEQNDGEFRGRSDRPELRNRFLSLIDSVEVQGYAVRVDLAGFEKIRGQLGTYVVEKHNEPFLHAFSALVQFMANQIADLPVDERIAFMFDRQDEFKFRALKTFDAMKDTDGFFSRRERLGAISFGDSKIEWPLQVADALAYRVHRDLRHGVPKDQGATPGNRHIKLAVLDVESIKSL